MVLTAIENHTLPSIGQRELLLFCFTLFCYFNGLRCCTASRFNFAARYQRERVKTQMPTFVQQYIKGTVHRDFRLSFFHHSNLPGSLTNGLKYFRFWSRFRRVVQIFQGIILRWGSLPAVWYRGESCDFSGSYLRETFQRDFRPPFFSSFEPAWITDQWVKIF